MAQIAPVLRVTVVLQVLPARRVWQPVLEPHAPDALHWVRAHPHGKGRLSDGVLVPLKGDVRVGLALPDAVDGVLGVEACGDGAAEGLDSGNGGLRGTGDNNIDGGCEGGGAAGEQFDAVFDAVHGARGGEFAEGDGLGGVDSSLVDPVLDSVEVYGGHVKGKAWSELLEKWLESKNVQCLQVLESFFSSDHLIWCLTALKLVRNFAMLSLAFVAST